MSTIALEYKGLIGFPFGPPLSTPSPHSTLPRLPSCPGNPNLCWAVPRAGHQTCKVGGTNMKLTLPSPQGIFNAVGKPEDTVIITWGAME